MRYVIVCLVVLLICGGVFAQTDTPTFTISNSPHVFRTLTAGQMTRFDYIVTAGSVHNVNLLTLIFASIWGMFLFFVFVLIKWQVRK